MLYMTTARATCEGRKGTYPHYVRKVADRWPTPSSKRRRFESAMRDTTIYEPIKNNSKMENKISRGFVTVSTSDGKYRIWMPRPTRSGKMRCSCSFGLQHRLPLIDAIDALPYIRMEEVSEIDEDYSTFVLTCQAQPYSECMERLMDDLPELMEEHLKLFHPNPLHSEK